MRLASKKLTMNSQPIHEIVSIIETEENGYKVRADYGIYWARRAVSCLIEPVPGDRVLIAGDPEGDLFVIAILERFDSNPLQVNSDRDLTIAATKGRIRIAAAEGVDIVTSGSMSLASSEFTVYSAKGSIFFDQLSCLGRRVFAEIDGMKLVGKVFDSIIERFVQKSKWSIREVDETDQVRSGQIDYRADNTMSLQGKNALLTAKELVKLDGDQIHLG
jgi:hypothetical protein